jgi:hypothetical protein
MVSLKHGPAGILARPVKEAAGNAGKDEEQAAISGAAWSMMIPARLRPGLRPPVGWLMWMSTVVTTSTAAAIYRPCPGLAEKQVGDDQENRTGKW